MREIDVQELARILAAGEPLYLLDVRQPWEHEAVALPGSILIPLNELPSRFGEIQPPAGALVVAYCHHGVRSLSASAFLNRAGFQGAVSLAGGIEAWSLSVDPSLPRDQVEDPQWTHRSDSGRNSAFRSRRRNGQCTSSSVSSRSRSRPPSRLSSMLRASEANELTDGRRSALVRHLHTSRAVNRRVVSFERSKKITSS